MNAAFGSGGVVLGLVGALGGIVTVVLGIHGGRPQLMRQSRTSPMLVPSV